MAHLTHVKALRGYRLHLLFSDGVTGEVDLTACLFGPMFEPLKDEAFFARVTLDGYGAPTWPNGADFAPDALHQWLQRDSVRGAKEGSSRS
jgi:hypothetical protein